MSLRSGLSILFERHAQALLGSLGRLARQPFATLLTVLVIGIALALPAALYLAVANMRVVTAGLDDTVQLSAYLAMATTPAEARKRAQSIAELPGVAATETVSPDEGLAEFRKRSGIGDALEALPEESAALAGEGAAGGIARHGPGRRAARGGDPQDGRSSTSSRRTRPGCAGCTRSKTPLQQLVLVVAALLAAGVLGIVGNTIRLEIDGRRAEIEVTKLVGGSNAFVRRPFLYSGLWQGFLGGLLAAALVAAGLIALEPFVARLAAAYGSDFVLKSLSIREWPLVVAGGAALGFLGAWLAAAYHLHRIEPRA